MFGWSLVRTEKLRKTEAWLNFYLNESSVCELENESLSEELDEAQKENERLFDLHNKRLTKPRKDKNGTLRNPDGEFAKND